MAGDGYWSSTGACLAAGCGGSRQDSSSEERGSMNAQKRATRQNGQDAPLDAVIVGAGFAGMYMLHRLRGMGFSTRVLEAGSGVGGTWYWNRYPGARYDVESVQYSYQFDDALLQEWDWSERYAAHPEIL